MVDTFERRTVPGLEVGGLGALLPVQGEVVIRDQHVGRFQGIDAIRRTVHDGGYVMGEGMAMRWVSNPQVFEIPT
jgi:hypothetical protein